MATFHKDFHFAWRLYAKKPGIAAILLLSLSLGIAATTTVFSVIYGVLLAPPLYKDTNRLVVIWESNKENGLLRTPVAPASFHDWLKNSHSFQDLELVAPGSPVTVMSGEVPERANIQYATPGLFALLGIQPTAGRFFRTDELKSTNPVILSHGFWSSHFPADYTVVGRQIIVNGTAQTVVGILPPGFHLFESETDLWMPIALPGPETQDRTFRSWLIAVGKLRPDATQHSAQVEMNFLSQRIASLHQETNHGWGVIIDPIQNAQYGYWKPILYLLFGIVSFVLLISCANVSSLLLVRLSIRSRELCVRASLGASKAVIIKQLIVEGILLGAAGSILGSLLTYFGLSLFRTLAPEDFPLVQSIQINLPVLFSCLVISLASGVVASVSPAYFASRLDLIRVLKSTTQSAIGGAYRRCRDTLVVAEIAMSLVLLFGAGLMINSMLRLLRVNPGFRPDRVVTMQIFLAGPKYFEFGTNGVSIRKGVKEFYGSLLERTKAIPGVNSVGLVSWLPEMGYNTGRRERAFRIPRRPGASDSNQSTAAFNMVSADYFTTLQIPLLRGRFFLSQDDENAPPVALVNQSFATRFFAGDEPVGKTLLVNDGLADRARQVIGVVGDVRQDALDEKASPEIFVPYMQEPGIASPHGYQNRVHLVLVVRSALEPAIAIAAVRKIGASLDNTQPVFGARTMSEVLSESTSLRRMYTRLLEVMAGIALFLATIGIYGVISHSVVQRSSEIGLRIAVGATRADILRLIFSQAGKLILAGFCIALVLAFALNGYLASYLFEIRATDPMTIVACCVLLGAVALGAVWIPAHRATRVDPIVTLHYE